MFTAFFWGKPYSLAVWSLHTARLTPSCAVFAWSSWRRSGGRAVVASGPSRSWKTLSIWQRSRVQASLTASSHTWWRECAGLSPSHVFIDDCSQNKVLLSLQLLLPCLCRFSLNGNTTPSSRWNALLDVTSLCPSSPLRTRPFSLIKDHRRPSPLQSPPTYTSVLVSLRPP